MITGSDMPPEIREIVDEAGPANCFYYSDRWRQSTKPSDGEPASEMPNTVPGSEITAEQTVDSAKPISDNRGYSFEGDDLLAVDGVDTDPDALTVAFVYEQDAGSGLEDLWHHGDGGDVFIRIRPDASSGDVECGCVDSGGNFVGITRTPGPPDDLSVICLTFETDGSTTTLTATDDIGSSDTDSGSITGTYSASNQRIGANGSGAPKYTGNVFECLIVETVALSDPMALVDRMAWRHDL